MLKNRAGSATRSYPPLTLVLPSVSNYERSDDDLKLTADRCIASVLHERPRRRLREGYLVLFEEIAW
jgi:hypothetical protein